MKKREGEKIEELEICDFHVFFNMKMNKIIISSRASKLAVWQTNYIADLLRKKLKNIELEVLKLNTLGDIRLDTELSKIGGKAYF